MTSAAVQNAARELDRHCTMRGITALIGLSSEQEIIVYAQNRKAFRKATRILPKVWHTFKVKVVSYSKARASIKQP